MPVLAAVLAALTMLAPAGTPAAYPEFPYPATGYDEPRRGQFHFSPRAGWMNDINAPLYLDGTYHLFFQHNPHGLAWDTMHWGHATSTDLVHWTQQPIALEPGVHPGDLWSGGGVVDVGNTSGLGAPGTTPIVVFTGTDGVRVNYSTDGARTFQPYDGGREVIDMPAHSRDPKVLWHAATRRWVMVVWSDAGGNAAHFYTSPDLLRWTFTSRYAADWLVECPDLVSLRADGTGPEKWVLTDASGEYVTGSFDGARFTADSPAPRRMDFGDTSFQGSFYGGLTFDNMPDGRVVQMVWMPGNHGTTWTGSATFPVTLGLRTLPDGLRVTRTPVAELAGLRTTSSRWQDRAVAGTDTLGGFTADTYDLTAEFDTTGATATRFGLRLHDRVVGYDRSTGTLDGAPLPPRAGRIRVRVLVDRGQLEIFGNDGEVSVTRSAAFPSGAGAVQLFAEGGSVRLVSLDVHRMRSSWTVATVPGMPGQWSTAGGAWTDVADGVAGQAAGDGFRFSSATGDDLAYQADVRLDTAQAAGITFRDVYTANVDAAGLVKLWRPGRDIAVHPVPIARGRAYHLRVVADGPRIRVYLDHGATPVIDATDDTALTGRFGFNVFAGRAELTGARLGDPPFTSTLTQPWRPVTGTWTLPRGRGMGDAFTLNGTTGADFTYAADVRIVAGRAAALTFRADAGATAHYTATLDAVEQTLKLWRPGAVLAAVPVRVVPGRAHHLAVRADGPRLRVHLDHAATPAIDVTDTTRREGHFGLNVFDGVADFDNVVVTPA